MKPAALRRIFTLALAVGFVTGCQPAATSPVEQSSRVDKSAAEAALVALTIRSGRAAHVFKVELALTEAQQSRGLMFRRSLPVDGGMLFPFDPPRRAVFWMKNTVIPLDFIFIRPDHSIARIAAKATPLSEEPIDAGEPVAAVLEIEGGHAALEGITAGDLVDWSVPSAGHP